MNDTPPAVIEKLRVLLIDITGGPPEPLRCGPIFDEPVCELP
ncbi:hypothetical protein [uncultured Tateyamaria sp.]|nr:hypothetical protein [uncultured Tateyamaria sp.]